MSVAPFAGVVALDNFKSPTIAVDGIQGQVPKPLAGQNGYVLTADGWVPIGTAGAVTSVDTAGTVNGITLTGGPITTSGTITLGGTLDLSSPPAIGGTTPAAGTFTTLIGGKDVANYGQLTGGATTKAVQFQTLGTDTNVSMALQPKGTGAIDLAAGSSGVNISNGGTVTAITRTAGGSTYTSVPTVAITAPTTAGGVQAVATATVTLSTGGAAIASGGTGYTVSDVLTVSSGTGTAIQLTVATVSSGVITGVTITGFGSYSIAPTNPVSVTGGTGSSATFNLSYGVNTVFTITTAGSGYVEQPTVTFSGGGGSGAAAYATVGSGTVVKSLGTTMDFATPNGVGLRLTTGAGSTLTDFVEISGGISGLTNGVYVKAGGSTANNALYLMSKGTLPVSVFTNQSISAAQQFSVAHTASAVNYVQVTGGATNVGPTISVQGSDSDIALNLTSKASNPINFYSKNGGNRHVRIDGNAVSVNYVDLYGSISGSPISVRSNGADADIDIALTPKGAGNVRFATYTAGIIAQAGYITIKDSGGTVRRLLVG